MSAQLVLTDGEMDAVVALATRAVEAMDYPEHDAQLRSVIAKLTPHLNRPSRRRPKS